MAAKHLELKLAADACDFIAETAYDPVYGARPLKRFIQRQLETKVARALIGGEVAAGTNVIVNLNNGELEVTIQVEQT